MLVYKYSFAIAGNSKDDAIRNTVNYFKLLRNAYGFTLKAIFSDLGSEFNELFEFAASEGMLVENSISHCYWQKGKLERNMRTIKETARTKMSSALVSDNKLAKFWFGSARMYCGEPASTW